MIYLLDTDTCIACIRNRPLHPKSMLNAQRPGTVGMSVITACELMVGAAKSSDPLGGRIKVDLLLQSVTLHHFTAEQCDHYAEIREYLERLGLKIGAMDTLIAAHARSLDAVLVTNNTREFSRVPGLQVENWFIAPA